MVRREMQDRDGHGGGNGRPAPATNGHRIDAVTAALCAAGAPTTVYEPVLVETAEEIRRFAGPALLATTCGIGRIIFERLYGGDLERWRSRGPKSASLRRLADLLGDGATFSVNKLYRCVAIHLAVVEMGSVPAPEHLSPTHIEVVLPLPPEQRRLLLDRAVREQWSTRQLASQVRRPARSVRRAPRQPGAMQVVEQMGDLAQHVSLDGGRAFRGMTEERLRHVCGNLAVAKDRIDELHRVAREFLDAATRRARRRSPSGPTRGRGSGGARGADSWDTGPIDAT